MKKPQEFYTTYNEFDEIDKYDSQKDALDAANEGDTIIRIQVTEIGSVEKSIKVLVLKTKAKAKKKKGRKGGR